MKMRLCQHPSIYLYTNQNFFNKSQMSDSFDVPAGCVFRKYLFHVDLLLIEVYNFSITFTEFNCS